MARFHPLPVAAVDRLTDDSVALTLTVPPELRETFRHTPGQHLALRRLVDGTEIRRTYSICAPAALGNADPVLRSRADAPYACKGGVCGTCRAFLVSGEVRMDRNFALEQEETEAGYVLACQSHPATPEVELDFDR